MDDWTILVKNAIAVLVLMIAISVVIFLAYLGLNAATKGGEKMSETVSAMDARTLETFDQKTVSGTTALTAIKVYRNRAVSIVVRTNATITCYNAYLGTEAAVTALGGSHDGTIAYLYTALAIPSGLPTQTVAGTNIPPIAYTALNANDPDNPIGLTAPQGFAIYETCQNLNIAKATGSKYPEYINPNAKFRSVIIYDVNGEPVGIYLEQTTVSPQILKF